MAGAVEYVTLSAGQDSRGLEILGVTVFSLLMIVFQFWRIQLRSTCLFHQLYRETF